MPASGQAAPAGRAQRETRPASRLPGAAASLRVQLSPQELLAQQEQEAGPSNLASQSRPSSNSSLVATATRNAARQGGATNAQLLMQQWQQRGGRGPPQRPRVPQEGPSSSDTQLLAASILAQQRRKALILQKQEELISDTVGTQTLKRALTYFGPSSWTQVLHERHLAGCCGYPTCANKPALPEISQRASPLAADKPRYRISLANRSITRSTDDDPGGRNAFCSDECWRRAEWVRRWVLTDEFAKGTANGAAPQDAAAPSLESGRFEQRWTEDQWREIELLEDTDVERLGALAGGASEAAPARTVNVDSLLNGHGNKPSASDTAAMIDSLVIHERSAGPTASPPAPTPSSMRPAEASTTPSRPKKKSLAVRGDNSLGGLMGGFIGKEATSSLLREIQATSRQGQARAEAEARSARRYESDSDGGGDGGASSDEESEDERDEAQIALDEAKERERAEIARLMDEALGVRDEQRERGALDEDAALTDIRKQWQERA